MRSRAGAIFCFDGWSAASNGQAGVGGNRGGEVLLRNPNRGRDRTATHETLHNIKASSRLAPTRPTSGRRWCTRCRVFMLPSQYNHPLFPQADRVFVFLRMMSGKSPPLRRSPARRLSMLLGYRRNSLLSGRYTREGTPTFD